MAWFKQKAKYGATRVSHAGRSFASKLESGLFDLLTLRERAGEISDIRCQHTVDLVAAIRWRVDYSFTDKASGLTVFAEAKGFPTEDFKLKLKLWRVFGPGVLELWGGSHTRLTLMETITPSYTRDVCRGCKKFSESTGTSEEVTTGMLGRS